MSSLNITPLNLQPRTIDSLHTLSVWKPVYANLMVQLHEIYNGPRCPYVNSQIWSMCTGNRNRCTDEEITTSLRGKDFIPNRFEINDRRGNGFSFTAKVQSATTVEGFESTWILVLKGRLKRAEDIEAADVTVVCYYDGNDRPYEGFCFLPELARQQLWSSNR